MPLPRMPPPTPPSFLGSTGFVTGEAGSLECGCLGYSPKADPGTSESPAGCRAVGTAEALRQPPGRAGLLEAPGLPHCPGCFPVRHPALNKSLQCPVATLRMRENEHIPFITQAVARR